MIVKKVVTESADKFQRKMTKLPSFFISLSLLKIFSLFPVHKGQNTWGWPSDLCKLQIWSYHPTPPYTEQSLRCAPNPQCGLEWPVSTPPCIIDLILQHPISLPSSSRGSFPFLWLAALLPVMRSLQIQFPQSLQPTLLLIYSLRRSP